LDWRARATRGELDNFQEGNWCVHETLTFVVRRGGSRAPSMQPRRNPAVASTTLVGLRFLRALYS
jgi:hypothetical protein